LKSNNKRKEEIKDESVSNEVEKIEKRAEASVKELMKQFSV